jgi:hypothetical protein
MRNVLDLLICDHTLLDTHIQYCIVYNVRRLYMQAYLLCALIVTSVTRTLSIDVPAPDYEISYHTFTVDDGVYLNAIGAPAVPSRRITIALPPGAMVEQVDFLGTRHDAGYAILQATLPPVPLSNTYGVEELWRAYLRNKDQYYSS